MEEGVPAKLIPCTYNAVIGIQAVLAERNAKEAAREDDDAEGHPLSLDDRYANDPDLGAPCFGRALSSLPCKGTVFVLTDGRPKSTATAFATPPPPLPLNQDGRQACTAKQLKAAAAKTEQHVRSRRQKLEHMEASVRAIWPYVSALHSDVAAEKVAFNVVNMGANVGGFTSRVVRKGSATVLD